MGSKKDRKKRKKRERGAAKAKCCDKPPRKMCKRCPRRSLLVP